MLLNLTTMNIAADYKSDFQLGQTTWVNCSHQGPFPFPTLEAIAQATAMKANPATLDNRLFMSVPQALKASLAKLFCASAEQIVLGNSGTYYVHLLAECLNWQEGDEIIVLKGDFPTNILSWLPLAEKGVKLKKVALNLQGFEIEELRPFISSKTRLICLSWINSFTGFKLDATAFGTFCTEHGILSCLNTSQAIGYLELDAVSTNIDMAFGCGYKWLLGPYGTGYGYLSDNLRQQMANKRLYWHNYTDPNYKDMQSIGDRDYFPGSHFDVFGTANLLNFMAWTTSLNYLLDISLAKITQHNDTIINYLLAKIDWDKHELISDYPSKNRGAIMMIKPKRHAVEEVHQQLNASGIFISLRQEKLRISPHIYNNQADIDRLVEGLNR